MIPIGNGLRTENKERGQVLRSNKIFQDMVVLRAYEEKLLKYRI